MPLPVKAPKTRRKKQLAPASLNDLFASRSKDTFLSEARAHVVAKHHADDSRRQDIIHPSEMAKADWCPRATYLRIETGIHHKKTFGFQSLNVFDTGHEAHRKWQHRAWDIGWLEGNFRCLNCAQLWWATSPDTCDRCSSKALEYAEVPVKNIADYQIAGHSDGLLKPIRKLLEIKTVGEGTYRFEHPKLLAKHTVQLPDGSELVNLKAVWADTRTPFPSHIRQGQIYMWLAQQAGIDIDGMEFIYESKFNQDVKSFTVKANADLIADRIEMAKDIKQRLGSNNPPACPKGGCADCNAYEETRDAPSGRGSTDAGSKHDEEAPAEGTETSSATGGGTPRTASRADRTHRRQPDESLRSADELVRVRRNTAGVCSSRRARS
ncbi:hypothetical protein [Streptomyces sp. WZ-12]|uniref:hypothetical protein n=1 Tax=Streptomyces sp. WZ-12 TaxID=3030210 RepID=UPI0023812D5B|nr:hypothetical protein [Streptomyces sp. WZ-12]